MTWSFENIDWQQTLTAAVGVATIVQAAIAFVMMKSLRYARDQADAASKAVDVAAQTAERQLRAYMTIADLKFEPMPEAKIHQLVVTLRNTGATPALNLCTKTKISVRSPDAVDVMEPDAESEASTRNTVGAGSPTYINMYFTDDQLRPYQDRLNNRELVVAVAGLCEYDDIYGKRHETRFRHYLADLPMATFRPTIGHNDMT